MKYIPLLLLLGAAVWCFWYYHNKTVVTTCYSLQKNIQSPIKILQLSDLHGATFGRDNAPLVKKIQAQKPDLIVITGDSISYSVQADTAEKLFAACAKAALTVVIPGNHERKHGLLNLLKDTCAKTGCVYLQNEIASLLVKGQLVHVLGLCETQATYNGFFGALHIRPPKENHAHLFERLANREGLHIVLSHYPENFKAIGTKSYNQYPFDIMFSGHAHGGQGRLFGQGIIAPGQGFFPRYTAGVHDDRLVISRGLGNSSVPLRVFNRPEVVVVKVK